MAATPTDELKTALMIVIPLGIAALTTWINITIRFAPDAAHAICEAKQIFLRVTSWIGNAVLAGMLVWEIVSPRPDARTSLLIIIFYSFSLFNIYVLWLFRVTMNLIAQQTNQIGSLAGNVGKLIDRANAAATSN